MIAILLQGSNEVPTGLRFGKYIDGTFVEVIQPQFFIARYVDTVAKILGVEKSDTRSHVSFPLPKPIGAYMKRNNGAHIISG